MSDRPGRPGPKYRQVSDDLRAQITSGAIPVDGRIPSKAELQKTHGVALNTVDRALEELRREGLIRSEQGAGTFVIRKPGEPESSPEFLQLVGQIRHLAARVDALERRQAANGADRHGMPA